MRASCSLALILLFSSPAWASSIRSTTIEERTRLSDRVVRVEVQGSQTKVPDGDVRRMMTLTTVRVLDQYKGTGAATVEVFQIGGKSGLWEAHVPEDARFDAGEIAVLFLRCRDARNPDRCTLVGLKTGKLSQVGTGDVVDARPDGTQQRRKLAEVVAAVKEAK